MPHAEFLVPAQYGDARVVVTGGRDGSLHLTRTMPPLAPLVAHLTRRGEGSPN